MSSVTESQPCTSLPLPSILLVEDEAGLASELRSGLECDGMRTRTASSLAYAISLLRGSTFDLVILDLLLPDAAGLPALKVLRRAARSAPVVVLATHDDEESALASLQAGAEDYLTRGQLGPRLVRTVRYAIERHRDRARMAALTDELSAKNAELAALNEQKDRFLGIAAHDLRNPLGVITGYCHYLAGGAVGQLDAEQLEIVETMQSAGEHMLLLIEDLLDFSEIQAKAMRLHAEDTDLVPLVEHCVRQSAVMASRKRIKLVYEDGYAIPRLRIDKNKFRQVLGNLISNAVKFSHPGSDVVVAVTVEHGEAVVSVSDHGIGIPQSERDRLFRPFEKIHRRGTAGERTTGLGLSIVRNIVDAHGGRIWVDSEAGKGSTFRVAFPLPAPVTPTPSPART